MTLRIPFAVPKVTVEVIRFVFAPAVLGSHRRDWLWETISEAKEKSVHADVQDRHSET